jgi:glycosyltransferase involved in cell wall biosynthesis
VARILFAHLRDSSFVAIDREALATRHEVRDWRQRGALRGLPALVREVRRSDLVFGWFASWHTFWPITLAALMRRPSVVVTGGYDTAAVPAAGYGLQQRRVMRQVSRWVMRRAMLLIANSRYTEGELERNAGIERGKARVVYHGVPDPFGALPEPAGRIVLTVGAVDARNLERKGLRPFVGAARMLPDVSFVVVGPMEDEAAAAGLRRDAPLNVTITGWVSQEELDDWYRRAAVYVQASLHEGFGMSVAEAMLGGCVPVVTRAGALPEVVGDAGVMIDRADPAQIASGIERALALGPQAGGRARTRVLEHFPLRARTEGLLAVVDEALAAR